MSLTIVNSSQQLAANLKEFLLYIQEQINVNEIKYQKDVDKYGTQICLPNLPILGPKFKGNKAFGDVKNGITKLTSAQIKAIRQKGQFEIAGNKLSVKEDLIVNEKFNNNNLKDHEVIGGQQIIISSISLNTVVKFQANYMKYTSQIPTSFSTMVHKSTFQNLGLIR